MSYFLSLDRRRMLGQHWGSTLCQVGVSISFLSGANLCRIGGENPRQQSHTSNRDLWISHIRQQARVKHGGGRTTQSDTGNWTAVRGPAAGR
jgi:hypothetical protein